MASENELSKCHCLDQLFGSVLYTWQNLITGGQGKLAGTAVAFNGYLPPLTRIHPVEFSQPKIQSEEVALV